VFYGIISLQAVRAEYKRKENIPMARYLKCPYCGKEKLGELSASEGKSWGLVEFDPNKDQTVLERTMPVDVFACEDCHSILLKGIDIEKI
jgi:DNA-directed RNA polymerase subunit RPC12/RpoP